MGRILTATAMILVAGVSAGCHQCMQGSYYDPCGGVVYGPSINPPTFLSGMKKNKHDPDNCPLCLSETPQASSGNAVNHESSTCCNHGHGSSWTASSNYGAAFDQPVSAHSSHQSNCTCSLARNCAAGCSGKKSTRKCCGAHNSGCNCSMPVSNCICDSCSTCQHEMPVTNCDTCSTVVGSYPGVVYDESFSSEPMILPGQTIYEGDIVLPETFSDSGDCPHCQPSSGPIFNGTIVPEHDANKPTPAPAAESTKETAPGESISPEPDVVPPTTMTIPSFPEPKPTRQVHFVPNTMK